MENSWKSNQVVLFEWSRGKVQGFGYRTAVVFSLITWVGCRHIYTDAKSAILLGQVGCTVTDLSKVIFNHKLVL